MMKRLAEEKNMQIMKRLTAILVAVVFVFGMMYLPTGVYAAEPEPSSETVETEAVETNEAVPEEAAAEENVSEESTAEEIVEDEESSADGNSIDELTDALSADLDSLDESEYDGFIYKMTDDTTKSQIREMEEAIDDLDREQEVEEIVSNELYTADSIETIAEVASPEQIECIEPNFILRTCGTSDDPYYNNYSWQMENTNVPYAWDRGMTGAGAVVAVLDSGVNTDHWDLSGVNFVDKYNVFDKSTDVTDDFGHGTRVTGVIAEAKNNGIGFVGAMPNTSIMPVKVLNKKGTTSISCVVEGISYAVDKKADVINMSFGGNFGGMESNLLELACMEAVDAGVILVAASGNEASNGNPVMYPAAYDCVISVGSVNKNNAHSRFSTYNDQVTVVAPGENVVLLNGVSDYYVTSGTSFAAPQVSALAAMMKSRDHSVSPAQFLDVLKSTATDLGDDGYDEYYGYGLIDFGKVFDYMATQFSNYSISLSCEVYNYNGSAKNPTVTLSLGTVKLVKDIDYKVTYASGRIMVGTHKVTATGTNNYSGAKTALFTIRPPLVKGIKAPQRQKQKLTVRWTAMSKKQKKQYKNVITGYQVRVSTSPTFVNAKYAKTKGVATTKVAVAGLKKKTTYYVQYRSYKTVGSATYYSKWSGVKKAKTK